MTLASISIIKARLADVARTVLGLRRAYTEAPPSLPASDLPIFCSYVGPVTNFSKIGEQIAEETRQYIGRLYVVPIQQGVTGEAEKAVEPFLTSLRDVFLSHPALGLGSAISQIPYVTEMKWMGDSGIVVLPFAGQDYLGTEFRLSVTAVFPIGLANYE